MRAAADSLRRVRRLGGRQYERLSVKLDSAWSDSSLRTLRYIAARGAVWPGGCVLTDNLPIGDREAYRKTSRRVASWFVARFFRTAGFRMYCSTGGLDASIFDACRRAPLAVSRGAMHTWLDTVHPGKTRSSARWWFAMRFPE
jgi:hypothetical protein